MFDISLELKRFGENCDFSMLTLSFQKTDDLDTDLYRDF